LVATPAGAFCKARFRLPNIEARMQLKLNERSVDGILIFDCNGRIVFGEESILLRERVKAALLVHKGVLLNLAETSYIDSGGLGTLVALRTSAIKAGASLRLASLTKRVDDVMQITKLLTVFDVYNSEAEALRAFRKEPAA
jgi:anti-sigma B factor antagonist